VTSSWKTLSNHVSRPP